MARKKSVLKEPAENPVSPDGDGKELAAKLVSRNGGGNQVQENLDEELKATGCPPISPVVDGITPSIEKEFSPLDEILTSTHYPPISPIGDGNMPLSAAINWIATKGLQVTFPLDNAGPEYHAAATVIQDQLISEKAIVYGENSDRDFEVIPGVKFQGKKFIFDFEAGVEDIAGRDNRIEVGVSEDGDCLFRAYSFRAIWTNMVVRKEDVRREWPFHLVTDESAYADVPDVPLQGRKAEAARQALLQEFPDRRVPNQLTIAQLVNRINQRKNKIGDRGGFERTTVLRALGRRH
jgi:hypothetical protein